MEYKNILAFRNDRFGEFLLNIPAFRALKGISGQAKLSLVADPYVEELAECIDCVDEVFTWENRRHSINEIIRFSARLRKRNFDLCVIFNPSKEFNIISFLSGIPVRVGYARKWHFLLTHTLKDLKYLEDKHEVDYNLQLAGLIGASAQGRRPSLDISEDCYLNLPEEFSEKSEFIAVHPWTSDPIKQWPVAFFLLLAEKITVELGMKVVIVGGSEEAAMKFRFSSYGNDAIIDMTGKTTLKGLGAILNRSRLLVSCDSGPVHLASCLNIPVVAIFRSDMPGKGSKRWGPLSEKSVVVEKPDLSKIGVEEVLSKIQEVLNK